MTMIASGGGGRLPPPPKPKPKPSPVGRGVAAITAPVSHAAQTITRAVAPPPTRIAPPPRRASSPKAAPISRLAHAIASKTPAQQTLSKTLERVYGGRDRAFALPLDPVTRDNTPPIVQRLELLGQFKQDFANLAKAGLLPRNAKMPSVAFPFPSSRTRSFEHRGTVSFPPLEVAAATNPQMGMEGWGQEIPIHELAHALQTPETMSSVPLREGGAQAFADAAVPAVVGPRPTRDTNYSRYVQSVRANKGVPWYMRRQFR